jgi:hypothetical protein
MENLQPLLIGSNRSASDITVNLEDDGQTLSVYLWISLLEKVPCAPDTLLYKMFIGRLYRMGFKASEISVKFGHDARTVKLWADALVSNDAEKMARAFAGRGGIGKITGELINVVKWLYRQVRDEVNGFRLYIRGLVQQLFGKKVSGEALRRIFREADAEDLKACKEGGAMVEEAVSELTVSDPVAPSLPASGCVDIDNLESLAVAPPVAEYAGGVGEVSNGAKASIGCAAADNLSSTFLPTRNWSPNFTVPLMPFSRVAVPLEWMPIHHSGLALALPLFDHYAQGLAGGREVPIQMIAQLLQGAVNVEQWRFLSLEDLSLFTGTSIASGEPQRVALDTVAGPESTLALYGFNARLLGDGPGNGDCFYLDPHCKKYTGVLEILKGWCGSQNGVAKTLNLDTVHTESGRGCFVAHYDAYHDLRIRFFMTLERFRQLLPPEQHNHLTFIIDRGIFGLSTFDRFATEKCRLITWEKGYERGTGWRDDHPVHAFSFSRVRNDSNDLFHYHFECIEYPWDKRPEIRRIIVRATSPKGAAIEVSVLCTDPGMPLKKIVRLIFNRWIQEGDFLMLVRHVGFNQLDSYKWLPYEKPEKDDDKTVISLDYRKKKKEIKAAEARLVNMIGEFRKLKKRSEQDPKAKVRHADKLAALETNISATDLQIEQLVTELHLIVKEIPKLQHLADTAAVRLNTRRKACFDALRITAANMTRALLIHFRTFYDNRRNDMAILRMLLNADGFVRYDGKVIQVKLWIKGEYQPKTLSAITGFLDALSKITSSRFATTHPPIRISIHQETNRLIISPLLPPP